MTAYRVEPRGSGIHLSDQRSATYAIIEPDHGNTVTAFAVDRDGRSIDLLMRPRTPFGPNGFAAGIPILFPFPNRVRAGAFSFGGSRYELDRNERDGANHIHGFVRGRAWTVDATGASDEEGAWCRSSIELADFPDIQRQFPFPATLTVRTTVLDGALMQTADVRNTGDRAMPMGYGLHPWFPGSIGSPRATATVRLPARRCWELDALLPTGVRSDLTGSDDLRVARPLDGAVFDDVFTDVVRRSDGWSEAAVAYPNEDAEIVVEASPEFREWVLYAPADGSVVCIEPYTCVTDAVNLTTRGIDAGLVTLAPGERWTGTVRMFGRHTARDGAAQARRVR